MTDINYSKVRAAYPLVAEIDELRAVVNKLTLEKSPFGVTDVTIGYGKRIRLFSQDLMTAVEARIQELEADLEQLGVADD